MSDTIVEDSEKSVNTFVDTTNDDKDEPTGAQLTKEYVDYMAPFISHNIHTLLLELWTYVPLTFILHSMYTRNIPLYYHAIMFGISYFYDNIMFIFGHFNLHKLFYTYPKPKDAIKHMNPFIYIAYLHHYYNPLIFSTFPKEILTLYLGPIPSNNNRVESFRPYRLIKSIIYIISSNILYKFMFPQYYSIVWAGIMTGIICKLSGLSHITLWCLQHAIIYHFTNNLAFANVFTAYIAFTFLLQGLAHHWYHTLNKRKFSYYGPFRYYLCSFLETIKIYDSEKHKIHHQHQKRNMHEAEHWEDMWIPSFMSNMFDKLWDNIYDSPHYYTYRKMYDIIYSGSFVLVVYLWSLCM
jgi:hypothetical protein